MFLIITDWLKKGNQSQIFIGRTDFEVETPILWSPDAKNGLHGKNPDAGKEWRREKGTTEDEKVGWHHWLNGHGFEQALGVGDGQGSLECCSPWGRRFGQDWVTELNWTDLIIIQEAEMTPGILTIKRFNIGNHKLIKLTKGWLLIEEKLGKIKIKGIYHQWAHLLLALKHMMWNCCKTSPPVSPNLYLPLSEENDTLHILSSISHSNGLLCKKELRRWCWKPTDNLQNTS